MQIPLPDYRRGPDAKAHPYPFQISQQTLEFLQAASFHAVLSDFAAGEYVRLPGGMARIDKLLVEKLGSETTYYEAWGFLSKYQAVFEKVPLQSVLIALNSHWDWYIRRLVDFIEFGRTALGWPELKREDQKRLARAAYLSIMEQIEVLELAAGIRMAISDSDRAELREMTMVRNLGLHNRWEVDSRYLERTPQKELAVGDLRIIEASELRRWHGLLTSLVSSSSMEVAVAFARAPDYP